MKPRHEKYIPFVPIDFPERTWPNQRITRAPVWCSVDLRDGNQALVNPMSVSEKLEYFQLLLELGVKEIEVGFPSASDTEFEFLRTLIDGGHIPDDVTIQVLVQAREHLIRRTFEAIDGAKRVIFHFYNSTSALQRKVVFRMEMDGIIDIAVEAANLIYELSGPALASGMDLRFEYSPESFMGTEPDNAVAICTAVMKALHASPERPVILNLPTTVENCMPNYFADIIEYFIRTLPNRDAAIISLHPHNDRGTGIATAELGLLAGAERLEVTLFGNGERTGNLDMVTMAMNMYTQGIDPGLRFDDINRIRRVYERLTELRVGERQPYAGDLVFTAFSGSHQDAINKGTQYMRESGSEYWEIPYLPIDPADLGRQYEPVIRINSQSGKGGAAFVLQSFGYDLPKAMHSEFGKIVQAESDRAGKELPAGRVLELFRAAYIEAQSPYQLLRHTFAEEGGERTVVRFTGTLRHQDTVFEVEGQGNGPIDAFFNAIHGQKMDRFTFVDYKEHAIQSGSDSMAVAYIHLRDRAGHDHFGVGLSHNINLAPLRGILSAINRSLL